MAKREPGEKCKLDGYGALNILWVRVCERFDMKVSQATMGPRLDALKSE